MPLQLGHARCWTGDRDGAVAAARHDADEILIDGETCFRGERS
ncbi:hypothetical protein SBI_06594 [Streptomyces bingchenggensis BCW-1]|uniref:Uncharacterized protein n=1 Tax=Streptomyces bingchenggensis (strain BCW-1) TaxID=749414 RepID=D7BVY5_STRBB|nr:hypothetical protein SBI_06594 [Streptomyces bingchenggensis BCW-1]